VLLSGESERRGRRAQDALAVDLRGAVTVLARVVAEARVVADWPLARATRPQPRAPNENLRTCEKPQATFKQSAAHPFGWFGGPH
jgi:hypothetical protein